MAQQLQASPTIEDIRFTNSLARQALTHGEEAIVLRSIDLSKLLVTVFHDAGWSNAPATSDDPVYYLGTSDEERGEIKVGPWVSKQRKAKRKNSRVASQLGLLIIMFTEEGAAQGQSRPASVIEWKSHACGRVCRSTFGAETMGCIEGIELGQYVRAMMSSLMSGTLQRTTGNEFPIIAMTDCRSLYDYFHKDGLSRTPTDRRLAVDIACLRQSIREEVKGNEDSRAPYFHKDGLSRTPTDRRLAVDIACLRQSIREEVKGNEDSRAPLVWVPTELQRADPLTKPRKPGDWWSTLTTLNIPLKEKMIFNRCKSEVVSEVQPPAWYHHLLEALGL
eukprot:s10399_g1.t1